MKKIPIQVKIGLLIFLAVILLSATGYLSYRSLSSIVSSINFEAKPELRIISIRDISMDLEKAENIVRIYKITRETQDLQPYYAIISNIDEKVSLLRSQCLKDQLLLEQVDTISRLIEENIVIWNDILKLDQDYSVEKYLKHLSDSLNSPSVNDRKTDKGILKRVFSRDKKIPLNEQDIINNINKIELQEKVTNEKLMTRESKLASTGNEIKEKFYDLIGKMESEVNSLIKVKATEANHLAKKTYRWLALTSVMGMLLALLVLFIIVRYVRKTYAYQVALEHSKEETENLARTKEMFVANMSHEIRTPVTAISGFVEQLLHESHIENTTRTLKIIKSSSDHLAKIIDDILDFSKLQTGKLMLEKVHFSIRQVIEDVYALFENQAQRNNTRLSYLLSPETPAILLGDPYRLKQIMINLVGNSVKFTKNGEIQYAVNCILKSSAEIELIMEFKDTGIGIDENKIHLIFEDFTQAEMSTTRKYGGTGLGLSIVKKLIELHNGSIDCTSRKNKGTIITCRMPYLTGDEKLLKMDTEIPPFIPEEVRKLRILIVDDEEYNRLLFKTILERWKVPYREAQSGMEAIEMLKTDLYDLIFMDIRMPGLDGIKTTRFIRDELKIKDSEMPIVAFSAACTKEVMQKYEKAGMNAFLSKPFTEKMLITTILSVIKNRTTSMYTVMSNGVERTPVYASRINLNNLYHLAGGDEQFVRHMLVSFIETTEKGLIEMNEAIQSGKWKAVAEWVHKISPPCRHIGAEDLHNFLKQIEKNIRNKVGTDTIELLARDSIREFEAVRKLLNERLAING